MPTDPPTVPHLLVAGRPVAAVEVAATRRARRRGLLGRAGLEGAIVLPGVRSVHTIGMHFAIDVAWLDQDNTVLRVRTMRPGRVSRIVGRARWVLEAEAGAFVAWGLVPGVNAEVG